jgi:hypothetical protein
MTSLKLEQLPTGELMLWVEGVPGFILRPDETLVACLERTAREFEGEGNGQGDWIGSVRGKYAEALRRFLKTLPHDDTPDRHRANGARRAVPEPAG